MPRFPSSWPRRRSILAVAVAALVGVIALGGFAISAAREEARRVQCGNNLRQIGLAIANYEASYGFLPLAAGSGGRRRAGEGLSWEFAVLPFLGCPHCWGLDDYAGIDPGAAWDAGPQRGYAALPLEPYLCPSSSYPTPEGKLSAVRSVDRSRLAGPAPTTYVGISGIGKDAASLPAGDARSGIFGYERPTRLADVRDGLAETMMVAETADLRGPWTAGGPETIRGVDPVTRPYIGPGRPFGGNHPGTALVLCADGSVRTLRAGADPAIFEALATIAGGEPAPAAR